MHCRNLCYKHINAYFKHRQASMVNASILHKQTQVLSSCNENTCVFIAVNKYI